MEPKVGNNGFDNLLSWTVVGTSLNNGCVISHPAELICVLSDVITANSGYPDHLVNSASVISLVFFTLQAIKVNGKKQQYAQEKSLAIASVVSANTEKVTAPR